jgi:membrane protease subunit (stomatin/prohibitin family)
MARTAVVAGTATAVSKGVSGKMNSSQQAAAQQQAAEQQAAAQQAAAQQAAAQQAAAQPSQDDKVERLKQLGELKNAGILTDEEFAAEKAKILNS